MAHNYEWVTQKADTLKNVFKKRMDWKEVSLFCNSPFGKIEECFSVFKEAFPNSKFVVYLNVGLNVSDEIAHFHDKKIRFNQLHESDLESVLSQLPRGSLAFFFDCNASGPLKKIDKEKFGQITVVEGPFMGSICSIMRELLSDDSEHAASRPQSA